MNFRHYEDEEASEQELAGVSSTLIFLAGFVALACGSFLFVVLW